MDYAYSGSHGECMQVLEDYFELKHSDEEQEYQKVLDAVRDDSKEERSEVQIVEGIIFNGSLVVIKDDTSSKINKVCIVRKKDKEIWRQNTVPC